MSTENECSWYDPSCAFKWFADELRFFAVWVYDGFMSGLSAIISAIPVPDFLANLQSFTLPPAVAWAAEAFNIPYGLAVIVSAYTARFILRRIPAVG